MKAPEGSRAANPGATACVTVWDYLNDELLDKVEEMRKIAEEMGISLSQLALAWILRQPNVASTIIGASRPSQVEENVKASGIKLTGEVLEKIEELVRDLKYIIKHNIVV
jgi:aryl-alcohol dehydrogenase-like predicted oxidoreductase